MKITDKTKTLTVLHALNWGDVFMDTENNEVWIKTNQSENGMDRVVNLANGNVTEISRDKWVLVVNAELIIRGGER